MILRDGRPEESARLFEIFRDAVLIGAATCYSERDRHAWCPSDYPTDRWHSAAASWTVRVADIDEKAVGFCAMKGPDYLHMLFVEPGHARQGIGAALVRDAMGRAQGNPLTTFASLCSEPVFRRCGWTETGRWPILRDGVVTVRIGMRCNPA